jgi:hypothetical protein
MDTNNFQTDEPRTPATDKKPYEKPSFRYEKVFVTTALSCGKVGSISSTCIKAQSAS